ncbi:FAD-binding domain-containing protein, partial [Flavihumibacter sp. CACIAM 22H1]|uniref:FAD-binding domain-containing protein n=1 Tax=Flavihumibacter sp. CACIAM 22H1 TaxID=1812911 RepID=UPI0025B7F9CA
MPYSFPTDQDSLQQRIQSINPEAYAKTRNFANGAVTALSPYISRGAITLPEVWQSLQERGYTLKTAYKFVQELAWREYFQRTWWHLGEGMLNDIRKPQQDVLHHKLPLALTHAATGIHAIDEGIRLLYETGYAHN